MTFTVLTLPQGLHTLELNFLTWAPLLTSIKRKTGTPTHESSEYGGNTSADHEYMYLYTHLCICVYTHEYMYLYAHMYLYIHMCHAFFRQFHKSLRTRPSLALMGRWSEARFKVNVPWEERPEREGGRSAFLWGLTAGGIDSIAGTLVAQGLIDLWEEGSLQFWEDLGKLLRRQWWKVAWPVPWKIPEFQRLAHQAWNILSRRKNFKVALGTLVTFSVMSNRWLHT